MDTLRASHINYLNRRFGIEPNDDLAILATSGSKEAIFHLALCLVGRSGGKKIILYPNPGYPVYKSSALYANGEPYVDDDYATTFAQFEKEGIVERQGDLRLITEKGSRSAVTAAD